tara:strand:+ start:2596 stop:2718 length:123 start_codon:yes stop_codon:yes gene_type:complete
VTHCEMALYLLIGAVALISAYVAVMTYVIETAKKGKRRGR